MTPLLLVLLLMNVAFGVFNVTKRPRTWEMCVALNAFAALVAAFAVGVRVA